MSIVLFLLFLSFYNSALLSAESDDRSVMLKVREQLGNPGEVGTWDEYSNVGYRIWNFWGPNIRILLSNGRVSALSIMGLNNPASFPDAICNLTELEDLYMLDNPGIHGMIPSCISKLSKLTRLFVSNTSLSGPVPSFYNNTKLQSISLSKNQLFGTIPQSLSALPSLNYLNLSSNYLSGTIPDNLVHGPKAQLDLSNNYLTGELPHCYGWVDFHIIDVSHNQLSGDASFLFGNQKDDYMINLSYNDFEFDLSYVEIPEHLYVLYLDHNRIFGTVPYSIVDTKVLWWLNLSYNKLCGEIPWGKYLFSYNGIANADVFSDNACLCGFPLAQCYNSAPAGAPIYEPPFDWAPGEAPIYFPPFDGWAPGEAPIYFPPSDGWAPGEAPIYFPPSDGWTPEAAPIYFPPSDGWAPAEAPIYVPPAGSLP